MCVHLGITITYAFLAGSSQIIFRDLAVFIQPVCDAFLVSHGLIVMKVA